MKEYEGRQGIGWSATLLRDGVVIGEARDDGNGVAVFMRLTSTEEEKKLLEHSKSVLPEIEFETDGYFLGVIVNYEIFLKKLKTKAKSYVMGYDEKTEVDEHGVIASYYKWKFPDTPELRKKIMEHYPNFKFLNDELETWEIIKVKK